eukprot:TRINITY_DN8892_c0_g1_i1.p2 TRINITY_DN8892_c0_g1~~TRINITY_DN8892_c0_g1_i1.p2  ORF type:complete len:172 (+),score=44.67 TRINITY_DN8892_c0_g1_i1:201-716(+)
MRRRSRHSLACAALLVVLLACSSLCELNLFVEQQLPRSRSHPSRLFATARAAGAEDAGSGLVQRVFDLEKPATRAAEFVLKRRSWEQYGTKRPNEMPEEFLSEFFSELDSGKIDLPEIANMALVTKANDVIREHTPEWCKHCNPANGGTGHRNPKDLPAAFVKSFVDKFDA